MTRRVVVWLVFFGIVLVIWEGALRLRLVSPAALAHPIEVARTLPSIFSPSGNLSDVWSTISRSLFAFGLSVPIGVVAGFLIFFGGEARNPAEFALDFARSIPATALVPVFLIMFGVGDTTKVAVGAFSSALVICLSALAGLRGRSSTRLGVARTLRLTGMKRMVLLDVPEAAPQLFLGMRTGISLALILVVVSEMLIGSNHGLGKVIADMRYTDDVPRLYAALVAAGAIGFLYNAVLAALERQLLHWQGR
jgi:ABC-type nitrate/sulfonate/bicarbonate transport system permease component